MKNFSFYFAAIFVSAFLAISGNTFASNQHNYNGNYCSSYYPNQSNDFKRLISGLRNNTGNSRWVSCPVLVDETHKTTGTSRVYVMYTGKGPLTCILYSLRSNGTILQHKSHTVYQGWLELPNITVDDEFGSYTLNCNIPPYAVLNTISFREKN